MDAIGDEPIPSDELAPNSIFAHTISSGSLVVSTILLYITVAVEGHSPTPSHKDPQKDLRVNPWFSDFDVFSMTFFGGTLQAYFPFELHRRRCGCSHQWPQ